MDNLEIKEEASEDVIEMPSPSPETSFSSYVETQITEVEELIQDPCLVCCNTATVHDISNCFGVGDVDLCLRTHLASVFILEQLLRFPKKECVRLLENTGVDPGKWFSLCVNCSGVVRQGLELHRDIMRLKKRLEKVREDLKTSLSQSFQGADVIASCKSDEVGVQAVNQLIRGYFKDLTSQPSSDSENFAYVRKPRRKKRKRVVLPFSPTPSEEVAFAFENMVTTLTVGKYEQSEIEDPLNSRQSDDDSEWNPPIGDGERGDDKEDFLCRSESMEGDDIANDKSENENSEQEIVPKKTGGAKAKKKWKRNHKLFEFPKNCNLCGIHHTSRSFYMSHKKLHKSSEEAHVCDLCRYMTKTQVAMFNHYKAVHKQRHPKDQRGKFVCDKCDYVTHNLKKVGLHKRVHMVRENFEYLDGVGKRIRCKLCRKEDTKMKMYAHMREVHALAARMKSREKVLCHLCDKMFAGIDNLKDHIRTIHEDPNRISCDSCAMTFISREKYEDHMDKHNRNSLTRTHVCEHCGRVLMTRNGLQQHYNRYHKKVDGKVVAEYKKSSPGDTKCKYCGVDVTTQRELVQHLKTVHIDMYTFKCDLCECSYLRKWELDRHVETKHRGGGDVACPFCGARFISKQYLRKHVKRSVICKRKSGRNDIEQEQTLLTTSTTDDGCRKVDVSL